MDILTIILVIVGIIVALLLLSAAGWVLKLLQVVFSFLWEGCSTSLGCIVTIIVILLFICAMFG